WFYVGYLTSCSSGGGGGLGGLYSTTYPNPVSDVLNIEISAVADTLQTAQASKQQIPVSEVKLYNQSGTLVRSLLATDTHIQLNVADLPAGIYYLHVGKKGKTPEIKTIIVNR
ncbi:MAG: T9SS type A sorting domain-containing protein, partial [Prevotellaceae bacterium]|nr:T9SS type A sorting domain-containing protein [Prevotellaceae bacterium]